MDDDVECYILGDVDAFLASFEKGDCAKRWDKEREAVLLSQQQRLALDIAMRPCDASED